MKVKNTMTLLYIGLKRVEGRKLPQKQLSRMVPGSANSAVMGNQMLRMILSFYNDPRQQVTSTKLAAYL